MVTRAFVTLSAATNYHLIRRRNANANPALPLQFDSQQLIDRILRTISETATAGRTLAQREENRICWAQSADTLNLQIGFHSLQILTSVVSICRLSAQSAD